MKVKQDQKSVYVTHGDKKVRPLKNRWALGATDTKTVFKNGDTVKKYHHGGSTLCTISTATVKETWFIHED